MLLLLLTDWLYQRSPAFIVLSVLTLGALWLALRRPSAVAARWPLALSVARVWAGALALTALIDLVYGTAAWLLIDRVPPEAMFRVSRPMEFVVVAPLVYALWQTVALPWRVVHGGSDPRARQVTWFGWVALSAVLLAWGSDFAIYGAFPFLGGPFHAMFAYTDLGRIEPAFEMWRVLATSLGFGAALLVWTTPVRWWLLAMLASAVGLRHWWHVVTWQPQSAAFHEAVTWLLAAIPPTIFLACAAAEGTRRVMQRRLSRAERGSREAYEAALAQVPDVEPEPYDRLDG